MYQVVTFSLLAIETIRLESIPPDKNAPRGASESSCEFTDSVKILSKFFSIFN